MKKITTKELLNKGFVVEDNGNWTYNGKTCVIDFFADWCVPCKAQLRILTELSEDYDEVEFYKVNVEDEYELAQIFNIKNLPTVYVCGKESKKFTGVTQKQKIINVLKTEVKTQV